MSSKTGHSQAEGRSCLETSWAMVGGGRRQLCQAGESLSMPEQEGNRQVKRSRGHTFNYGSL